MINVFNEFISIFPLWKSNVIFFLFSKTVKILKTEYKYGQYCTPLTQSDCRYIFVLVISSCYRTVPSAIWEIFSEFLIFYNLFHEPLGK